MLTITVPGLPTSLNAWSREHWRTRNAERAEWADRMAEHLLVAGCRKRKPKFKGNVEVSLTYRIADRRKHDLDNLTPKHLLDGMIGWVYDDDSQIVRLIQSKESAKFNETVITVREVE